MITGAAQRFSIRPKPAIIGICIGGSRTQPSRTCAAHAFAAAGAGDFAATPFIEAANNAASANPVRMRDTFIGL
ncbi:hypothetical protein [Lysobacter sp. yr284]|uniref:hypothetical protein n=1 Tax=Lysobacter sp. yr284 TaxID=1761791 RepID=UPI0020C91EAD|nr:hypothetical protein [Lysobacter sp. yr284]